MKKPSKAEYVKKQTQFRKHHCHWPECQEQVPPAMWGCKKHWFMLPKNLRDRVWATYRPGQEKDMRPSEAYLKVAEEVQKWIAEHLKGKK
jgi:CDP-diacylglycerol pyrophosphatase